MVLAARDVPERLQEVILSQVRRRQQQRVGRWHAHEKEVLDIAHPFVHVRRRQLKVQLMMQHVVLYARSAMRGMGVRANHPDVAVRRPHARLHLVEHAQHVRLRVARHSADEGQLRHLLDGRVDVRHARVDVGHAQLEHVDFPQFADNGQRRVERRDLDGEGASTHLGEVARAAALLLEQLHVLQRHQLLLERALQLQVLDRDRERRVPVDTVLPPHKRYTLDGLGLPHVDRAQVHRVERLDRQLPAVAVRVAALLGVADAREHLPLLGLIRDGNHLQPPEIRLRHVQLDALPRRRHHRALLARVPDDGVAVDHVLVGL